MIPLYHILVHIPSAVNDTIKVGDAELYLDTKFNEFQHRTMKAKVVGIPAKFKSELEIGDYIFHHHHVALNDTQVVDPKEKIYRVNYDSFGGQGNQAYLIEKPDGSLIAVADWVFLEPFDIDADKEKSFIEIITLKEPEKRWGRIVYGSQWLEEEGLAVGDVVYFAKDADYEMDINGRKLWRMQIHHLICQKL
jgi:hypothetical protein